MKQILFNTDMIRAILDERKTQTRRVVKPHIVDRFVIDEDGRLLGSYMEGEEEGYPTIDDAPHQEGDILYVRETMRITNPNGDYVRGDRCATADYKTGESRVIPISDDTYISKRWRPSIHMPKEAARLFLRVTGVRVERLLDISEEDSKAEGIFLHSPDFMPTYHWRKQEIPGNGWDTARTCFLWGLWASTIKDKSTPLSHAWKENPWVWVYEFERVEAPNGKTTK